MINLMNAAREKAGAGALQANATLQALALKKADDIVKLGYWSDTSPDLGTPLQMEQAAGFEAESMGAENIAEAANVSQAFALLEASPPHLANIMDTAFTQVGVAVIPITGGVLVEELFSGPSL